MSTAAFRTNLTSQTQGRKHVEKCCRLSANWLVGILQFIKVYSAHNLCSEAGLEGKSLNHKGKSHLFLSLIQITLKLCITEEIPVTVYDLKFPNISAADAMPNFPVLQVKSCKIALTRL